MKIFAPKETADIETRAALDPAAVKKLADLGADITVESGIGVRSDSLDKDYEAAGAKISTNRDGDMAKADIVCRVSKPSDDDVKLLKKGAIHSSNNIKNNTNDYYR